MSLRPRSRSIRRRDSVPAPAAASVSAPVSVAGGMAGAFAELLRHNLVDVAPDHRSGPVFVQQAEGAWRLDTDAAALVARCGLKAQAIDDWLAVARLPRQGFYAGLRLTASTFSRKGKDEALDPAVTERLLRQSALMVNAAEVFGDGAAAWMTRPHPLLGGDTPLDAGSNEYGGVQVREILAAIQHGGVV